MRRPVQHCATVLGIAIAALSILLAPIGFWSYAWRGVLSVFAAGGLCATTGIAAFWVNRHFIVSGRVIVGVLGAMAIRMGVPLVVCLFLTLRGDADWMAGFAYWLLPHYVVALAVETWFSLPVAGNSHRPLSARE